MSIYIHAPPPVHRYKTRVVCGNCRHRRTFVVFVYEWYGPYATCLGCGEKYCNEGRMERPFERGWRARSIAEAKRRWKQHAKAEEKAGAA